MRVAVRRLLAAERPAGVLVACSGGADSVALAAATAFEAPRLGIRAGLVTVDHGLQDGSSDRAAAVADLGRRLGLDPVVVRRISIGTAGGPEAAARAARQAALRTSLASLDPPRSPAAESGESDGDAGGPGVEPTSPVDVRGGWAVLLGHTLDDQAETVLLGLGRGSGPRSIAGMRPVDPPWLRPLLGVRRATARAAAEAEGLPIWDDPHNDDARFTRARLRHEVLPLLEDALAGGVADALARTAELLRDDLDTLDALAAATLARVRAGGEIDAVALAVQPAAIRTRVLREWLRARGVPAVTNAQLRAVDALVADWRGQGPVALPAELAARRRSGRLHVAAKDPSDPP